MFIIINKYKRIVSKIVTSLSNPNYIIFWLSFCFLCHFKLKLYSFINYKAIRIMIKHTIYFQDNFINYKAIWIIIKHITYICFQSIYKNNYIIYKVIRIIIKHTTYVSKELLVLVLLSFFYYIKQKNQTQTLYLGQKHLKLEVVLFGVLASSLPPKQWLEINLVQTLTLTLIIPPLSLPPCPLIPPPQFPLI